MNIAEILNKAQKVHLRAEMEVFLSYLLETSRLDLIARSDEEIPVDKLADLQKGWTQIQDGVPVAYLVRLKEFYGIPFYVDENVLVPRGETELLVDYVLEKKPNTVLEIGTGSGAISVALKKNMPELKIVATDVSEAALKVAERNVLNNMTTIEFVYSDLLANVDGEFDILVANLPYIGKETNNYISENVEKHEPEVALFGGSDGLRLYYELFKQIREKSMQFEYIMGEIAFSQGEDLKKIAEELLPEYSCEIRQDLQGLDRHFILSYNAAA